MIFSTKDRKLKKVRAVLSSIFASIITGKPQTLERNISGTHGRILIIFFSTCSSSAALSHLPPPPSGLNVIRAARESGTINTIFRD